jgi:hypothetical protein
MESSFVGAVMGGDLPWMHKKEEGTVAVLTVFLNGGLSSRGRLATVDRSGGDVELSVVQFGAWRSEAKGATSRGDERWCERSLRLCLVLHFVLALA